MENELKDTVERLISNRLLKSNEEISAFEDARETIASRKDPRDITVLCQAFDDDTEDYEVMFGLVHDIEHYDKIASSEIATMYFISSIPFMIDKAEEWIDVLLYRILNDDDSRATLTLTLNKSDSSIKSYVTILLKKIAKEDPEDFKEKVDEVI